MKLPAVAIVAAFSSGILLALSKLLDSRVALRPYPAVVAGLLAVLLVVAVAIAWRGWLWSAALLSLLCWVGLGFFGAIAARRPPPAALHCAEHGVLRDEPARLPWGYGFELNLSGVDTAEGFVPLMGGMRVGFTPRDPDPQFPDIHTGDAVSLLAEGRIPLRYKDPGAFDRREFLAREDIHLLATLRASVLLEKTAVAPASLRTRIARLRSQLRGRLDALFANSPESASILRAMLLGDLSFVDRAESVDFQKTGTFRVLVVAGLHVGALAAFLCWAGRKSSLPRSAQTLFILLVLGAYIVIVEQRAPVLRAGLMTAIVVLGSSF